MAVTRLKLGTAQLRKLAAMMPPEHWRGARELQNASHRPGKTAELGSDEIHALMEALIERGGMPETRRAVEEAVARVEESEHRERTRPRARDIAQEAMRRGGWRPDDF